MLGSAIRISLSGMLFACWIAGAAMALAADKPNVVVILADDMGYACSTTPWKPSINRLFAAETAFFKAAEIHGN